MQGEAVDVPGGAGTPRGAEAAMGLPPCRKVAAWPALSSQHFCSNLLGCNSPVLIMPHKYC